MTVKAIAPVAAVATTPVVMLVPAVPVLADEAVVVAKLLAFGKARRKTAGAITALKNMMLGISRRVRGCLV